MKDWSELFKLYLLGIISVQDFDLFGLTANTRNAKDFIQWPVVNMEKEFLCVIIDRHFPPIML
ncbi:Uncharacterised protein [Mycobacterium tuberculosis]|nr:Uncharacterised protein [Mycobacterium tuberculosis]